MLPSEIILAFSLVPELIIKSPAILVARELNAFAINPKHSHLTQEIINDIHSEGFEIHTWTVNKKNRIEELISWKVDGIITDFPDRLKKKVICNN